MLIGDGPLSIPPYGAATPAVVNITCVCRQRYVVINGEPDECGERVRRLAARRGALVVDARTHPFLNCACGEPLDFSAGDCAGPV